MIIKNWWKKEKNDIILVMLMTITIPIPILTITFIPLFLGLDYLWILISLPIAAFIDGILLKYLTSKSKQDFYFSLKHLWKYEFIGILFLLFILILLVKYVRDNL